MRQAWLAALIGVCLVVEAGSPAWAGDRTLFIEAIEDAAVPLESEIDRNLVAITDDNPTIEWRDPDSKRELRVVLWMSEDAYQEHYAGKPDRPEPADRPLWVTVAPQVKSFCQGLGLSGPALSDRLKQYLGLDPDKPYDRFAVLWVNRAALFRPCPDPQIDDSQCDLDFETGPDDKVIVPKVPRVENYKTFFDALYVESYEASGAPWTRLGYTYDWNPETGETGASEFMLAPSSNYVIEGRFTTDEYCAN